MKKLFVWCNDHILLVLTLFLLAFIPLYPKLPLIDIKNTWVYVRVEDFIVLVSLLIWGISVVRNRLTLKTPITTPILIFWIVGAVATLHGILLIFPDLADVFPNVAFLGFLRRIEYMSLFFVAYGGMKEKRFLLYVIRTLTVTALLVILYGIGQKYFGLPAFLTMNEEFAKGVVIHLSPLSRVSSTFGGQYDLAAYLVLVLPLLVSLFFGYRTWIARSVFFIIVSLGLFVLFMTVSRISVFSLVVAVAIVLLFQNRKLALYSLPLIAMVVVVVLSFSPGLSDRFGNTIKEIDVLVDAATGNAIGQVKTVPNTYFKDKVVKQQFLDSTEKVRAGASPSGLLIIPYTRLPQENELLMESNVPTGENLPQGSGYINLPLSTVVQGFGNYYYEMKPDPKTGVVEVQIINGAYILKKAAAYDLSFTTRFQSEWPHAFAAFKRNVLFGSGYGSVSMAVDNSYLRMIGEVGALGFVSFFSIFFIVGIYLKKIWSRIDSRIEKSFIVGFIAGMVGLGINGLFIDVFEASKVAFTVWLLTGVVLGILHVSKNISVNVFTELKKAATSNWAVMLYLFLATMLLFSPLARNFFVGDDFTWFRWVADSPINAHTVLRYFTHADGFFYRPGAKIYFLFMYSFFWLNQTAYHAVSLLLHFVAAYLVFVLAKKIFKRVSVSALAAFLFLVLSGTTEALFWISATGFLFTACFSLLSLLTFISWLEKRKTVHLVGTAGFFVLSLLFHELGIVTPLLWVLYLCIFSETVHWSDLWKTIGFRVLFLPLPMYAAIRFFARSHWLSGDYNYNLIKLPFNVIGNAIGYAMLTFVGFLSDRPYELLRSGLRSHIFISALLSLIAVLVTASLYTSFVKKMEKHDRKVLAFGWWFFVIGLVPFLGLGNISSRYGYFASIGIVFIFVFFLEKLYTYLLDNGRDIAGASVAVIVCIFILLQIVQLRQLHNDWYEAGEKVRHFFISIDSLYDNEWKTASMEFHFINVPIRLGEAWVFPVGLPDAVWFVFRNPQIKFYIWPSIGDASAVVPYASPDRKIFMFRENGSVSALNTTLQDK